MRFTHRLVGVMLGLTVAATAGCSSITGPGAAADQLAGRWEGTSGTGVAYVYVYSATGQDDTNPRTGSVARTYDLAYTTTPGSSGSATAWYEGSKAYWGNTSLGTIVDDSTMTVEAGGLAPFAMHKRR